MGVVIAGSSATRVDGTVGSSSGCEVVDGGGFGTEVKSGCILGFWTRLLDHCPGDFLGELHSLGLGPLGWTAL